MNVTLEEMTLQFLAASVSISFALCSQTFTDAEITLCSGCLFSPIPSQKGKHLLLSSAQWDLRYAAEGAKLCATLKAEIKSPSAHTCKAAPAWSGVFFFGVQHTHTLKRTHSGDFVGPAGTVALSQYSMFSTLTRTVWPLCVRL